MDNYIIAEGAHLRGFFSNFLTILHSIKTLQQNGVLLENIKLGPNLFRLYGQANNWFDSNICSYHGVEWDSLQGYAPSRWPTCKELQYYKDVLHLVPWNSRVKGLIFKIQQKIQGSVIGVHFRGTDHNRNDSMHGNRIELEVYKKLLLEQCIAQQVSQIFVCTDEQGVVENIQKWVEKEIPQTRLIYNDFCKTNSTHGLHLHHSPFNKIQIADEVIQDMTCLSKCQVIIGKTSNVSTVARLFNPDVQMVYCDQS